MKTKNAFILVGLSLFLTACSGNKKPEKTLTPLTETLSLITQNTDEGKELHGVVETATGKVIIPACDYENITADENFILCRDTYKSMTSIDVYFTNGKVFGKYDTFTRWKTAEEDYYQGTNYRSSTFYFPRNGIALLSSDYLKLHNWLILKNNVWQSWGLDGELYWLDFPDNSTLVLNKADNEYYLICSWENESGIYSKKGTLLKYLTKRDLRKLEQKFQNPSELKDLKIVEVDNLF